MNCPKFPKMCPFSFIKHACPAFLEYALEMSDTCGEEFWGLKFLNYFLVQSSWIKKSKNGRKFLFKELDFLIHSQVQSRPKAEGKYATMLFL